MPLPLIAIAIGANAIRLAIPKVAQYLMKEGFKKATKTAAKKATKKISKKEAERLVKLSKPHRVSKTGRILKPPKTKVTKAREGMVSPKVQSKETLEAAKKARAKFGRPKPKAKVASPKKGKSLATIPKKGKSLATIPKKGQKLLTGPKPKGWKNMSTKQKVAWGVAAGLTAASILSMIKRDKPKVPVDKKPTSKQRRDDSADEIGFLPKGYFKKAKPKPGSQAEQYPSAEKYFKDKPKKVVKKAEPKKAKPKKDKPFWEGLVGSKNVEYSYPTDPEHWDEMDSDSKKYKTIEEEFGKISKKGGGFIKNRGALRGFGKAQRGY
tara:strand:+ start:750 stop:1718 length:969 start_codon:yes stop_codon:yes gene_type:complete